MGKVNKCVPPVYDCYCTFDASTVVPDFTIHVDSLEIYMCKLLCPGGEDSPLPRLMLDFRLF